MPGQSGGIKLHAAESCVAAQKAGQHAGIERAAVPVAEIDAEQHRQIANDKGTADIDQEGAQWEAAMIALAHQPPDPPAQHRASATTQPHP